MLHNIPALLPFPAHQLLLGHGQGVVSCLSTCVDCAAAVLASINTVLVQRMVDDRVLDLSGARMTCKQMKRKYFRFLTDLVRM